MANDKMKKADLQGLYFIKFSKNLMNMHLYYLIKLLNLKRIFGLKID